MPPVIVANFDAEIEMARAVTVGPHPRLPSGVRRWLDAAASQLGVLAAGARVVRAAGDVPPDASAVLGWAETESVAAARSRQEPPDGWPPALWSSIAAPAVVARVNDRRFWFELAGRRGWLLPEAGAIHSVAELRERLPKLAAASADGGWSVKAPLSAAGRERVHRWGAELPDDVATRVERMLERFGVLLAEPWMPRVLDVGVAGIIDREGIEIFAPHCLEVDVSGTFRKVVIDDGAALPAAFAAAAHVVAEALRTARYLGAFGIDGFVYRSPDGSDAIAPVCEINARLTFGLVARCHQRESGAVPFAWSPG